MWWHMWGSGEGWHDFILFGSVLGVGGLKMIEHLSWPSVRDNIARDFGDRAGNQDQVGSGKSNAARQGAAIHLAGRAERQRRERDSSRGDLYGP